jgi:hypothetical protein
MVARAALAALLCSSVAGAQRPESAIHATHTVIRGDRAAPADGEIRIEGTLGTLSEEAIESALKGRRAAVDRCYRDGVGKLWYLGGAFEVRVRVRGDGSVKEAGAVTPLGNYEVERCIVGAVSAATFPQPKGGAEAEFNYSWHFLGRASLLPWGQRDVERHVAARKGELQACGKRRASGLRVAFFVGPGGKVTSVGVGADGPIDDRFARCVADRVAAWRFDDPLGRMARAVYQF